jgi:hypothetical protein
MGKRCAEGVRRHALLSAGLLIGGCGITSTVSDDVSLTSLTAASQAVAIITVSIDGETCPLATIQLAKRSAAGYEATTSFSINTSKFSLSGLIAGSIPQVPLAAGEHHIVSYLCSAQSGNTTYTTTIGQKQGAFFGIGGTYKKSLANFTLAAGEVVDIGYLRIIPVGVAQIVTFHIQDQPPSVMEQLQKTKPKLFAQMKTRLMNVVSPAMTDDQRKVYCEMMARMASTQAKPTALPTVCLAQASAR